ncbi:TetR family transcriptional regulator [Marivita sp.]|uniref:TetR family transcriptional regulator n=1 Tax=Marivita sp. TaxID=2003365 RepID=UPI003F6BCE9E
MKKSSPSQTQVRSRDPERTKGEILHAALAEFAAHGYDGAKVQKISESAGCNPRLIYHYYDNKECLYLAVLRHIYAEIRAREDELRLEALPPDQAIVRLAELTFDFFQSNTVFLSITRSENLLGGRFIAQMPEIQKMSTPFLNKISDVLKRGHAEGVFRDGIDALQLYVSIVALSAHHINASHTLSATFGTDVSKQEWRQTRKLHVVEMIRSAVALPESHS